MPDAPTPLDLDAIKSSIAACRTYNFGMYQADRLAHEHAPALVEEVKRLRADVALLRPALAQLEEAFEEESDAHDALKAEVARLTARPAPAWDEEVVVEAVATALHGDGCPEDPDEGESCTCSDHLPVKPDRETVIAALAGLTREQWDRDPGADLMREELRSRFGAQADAVLALLSGRSEAEVKEEALREAAGFFRDTLHDHGAAGVLDRLAAEGGADRG